ncbi:hypothetical protein E5J99_14555 [Hymenobacter elongatus]|uniref:Uncharacterized protein n=1 Tax=Hymenobacter elongatus TaxID=877208 RepID=A0A4Z0PHZ1_9BACT|nr:hypothetical protein E5J99_14555 [Hymenobacter elongatus]
MSANSRGACTRTSTKSILIVVEAGEAKGASRVKMQVRTKKPANSNSASYRRSCATAAGAPAVPTARELAPRLLVATSSAGCFIIARSTPLPTNARRTALPTANT